MTQTGTVLGTSDYIAPEQAQGQRVDEHTDVYSLGVVLYELLTSEVPFPGENFVAVAMRHINEEPPPIRDKRPDVSPRSKPRCSGRWRSGPRTGSRRWPTSAASSRRASPRLQAARTQLGARRVARERASGAARRASPWPWRSSLLVALIAIGVVVAALLIGTATTGTSTVARRGRRGGGRGRARRRAARTTRTAAASEHDADAPKATDGMPTTYWETERYHDAPSLGKPGVGLVLDASATVQLHSSASSTETPGFIAEIRGGRLVVRAVPAGVGVADRRRRRRVHDSTTASTATT